MSTTDQIVTITTDDGHTFSTTLVLPRLPAPLPAVAPCLGRHTDTLSVVGRPTATFDCS